MSARPNYESDREAFPAEGYSAAGWGAGIAWRVLGWEVTPDADTEWSGIEERTGRVVAVMVGDDKRFAFEPDSLTPIDREAFCGECGQVGCTHDGYDRDEDEPDEVEPAFNHARLPVSAPEGGRGAE